MQGDPFNPVKSFSGPGDPLLRWDTLMYIGREGTFDTLPERGSRVYKDDFIQDAIDAGYIRDEHSHFRVTSAGREQLQGVIVAVVKAHPFDDDLAAEQLTRLTDMNSVDTDTVPAISFTKAQSRQLFDHLMEAQDD